MAGASLPITEPLFAQVWMIHVCLHFTAHSPVVWARAPMHSWCHAGHWPLPWITCWSCLSTSGGQLTQTPRKSSNGCQLCTCTSCLTWTHAGNLWLCYTCAHYPQHSWRAPFSGCMMCVGKRVMHRLNCSCAAWGSGDLCNSPRGESCAHISAFPAFNSCGCARNTGAILCDSLWPAHAGNLATIQM